METSEIKKVLLQIQERNLRVEADKAWETSWARKILVSAVTYACVVLFMISSGTPKPFLNALVPTGGYLLSTLSIPHVKSWWLRHRKNST